MNYRIGRAVVFKMKSGTLQLSLLVLFFTFGLGLYGCENTDVPPDVLPFVFVNESVYLNTAEGITLNQRDGAWIYHTGGLSGLIVYRQAVNSFAAFERRNPNTNGCTVKVDPTGFFMVDSCTSSQHFFDGTIRGTDVRPLRQYVVNNDGTRLIITNN